MRLFGQNTVVNVISLRGLELGITDVKDCTVTLKGQIVEGDYLGQTTTQAASLCKGYAVKFTANATSAAIMDLIDRINKARRGEIADSIEVVTTLNFADGIRRVALPDVQFGDLEVGIGGRTEMVNFPFNGQCSEMSLLPA